MAAVHGPNWTECIALCIRALNSTVPAWQSCITRSEFANQAIHFSVMTSTLTTVWRVRSRISPFPLDIAVHAIKQWTLYASLCYKIVKMDGQSWRMNRHWSGLGPLMFIFARHPYNFTVNNKCVQIILFASFFFGAAWDRRLSAVANNNAKLMWHIWQHRSFFLLVRTVNVKCTLVLWQSAKKDEWKTFIKWKIRSISTTFQAQWNALSNCRLVEF